MDKKKLVVFLAPFLLTGLVLTGTLINNAPNGEDDDGITKGPFWHPPNSPNHFSVRHVAPFQGPNVDPTVTNDNYVPDIYIDVNNIVKPIKVNLDYSMYNHENRQLYFSMSDNGTSSTTGDAIVKDDNLGSVAGDGGTSTWTYTVTIENVSTPLGSTEVVETLDLKVSSWEDSGYSTLYTRDNFDVDVHFIDRTDAGWTTIDYDNFDTGTTQGWSLTNHTANSNPDFSSGTTQDIYRSENYAVFGKVWDDSTGDYSDKEKGYINAKKEFDLSGYSTAYIMFSHRMHAINDGNLISPGAVGTPIAQSIRVMEGVENIALNSVPSWSVWYKHVSPLKTKLENVTIASFARTDGGPYTGDDPTGYGYLDEVYVIAK